MIGAAILLLNLAAQQQAIAVASDVSTSDPITLFEQVCLSDSVRLSKTAFEPIAYGKLPKGAREALGFTLPAGPVPTPGAKDLSLPDAEVPNKFYGSRTSKAAYLMLPAPSGATGRVAEHCGVIWKGRHYTEALKAARTFRPIPTDPPMPGTYLPGYGYSVIRSQGAVVGVAEYVDWTVMRVAADTSPEEQTAQ